MKEPLQSRADFQQLKIKGSIYIFITVFEKYNWSLNNIGWGKLTNMSN